MKTFKTTSFWSYYFIILLASIAFISSSCDEAEMDLTGSYTITVGAFTESNGVYTATGNQLVFNSKEECQTWSRTAQGDLHSSTAHLHYNAAANVSYNETDTIFSWTEYGPELDQAAIDATCAAGLNGVSKTVNTSSYYQDKPNVYLKIIQIEQ